MRCIACKKIKVEIFHKGMCYPCHQEDLDNQARKGIISWESANLWRSLPAKKVK